MAGFGFSEAQEMFRAQVRRFAARDLRPGAHDRAKQHRLPKKVVKKLGEASLLGISVPEEYGGAGADWVSYAIGVEEVSRVDLFAGFYMMMPTAAFLCLKATSPAVRSEWLPGFMGGDKVVSFAITEPGAGSDAGSIEMKAVREGDHYVLNGEKTSISLGYESDASILFARTGPGQKAKGVTCFLVPLDLPGVSRSLLNHTGWKPMTAASIVFEDVRIPEDYRAGEEGGGFRIFAASGADFLRPSLSLMALAQAQTSLDEAVAYALQRKAFGRPIARFEGVSFKIAEHATRIEAARLLCYRTFYLRDQGQAHTRESAMCKWLCPVVAFEAVHDAILIHGHAGYSEDLPLEQRLRDIMGFEFADGTAQIMKIIIAREMMGRESLPY
ncbi:MAG: acyl-CoA dehydrogenase family protein [Dehalococcoidia bacterium]|nr:acyl-CoA dehydrogenase family protein [Dehalococcoidia bacterium]